MICAILNGELKIKSFMHKLFEMPLRIAHCIIESGHFKIIPGGLKIYH